VSQERDRRVARRRRQARGSAKTVGTPQRPRLCVTKSLKHIYAQIIDDTQGHTLVAASTIEEQVSEGLSSTANTEAAVAVGEAVAKRALAEGIEQVVFDRAGWPYHGKVAALAEAAREAGLKF